LIYGVAAMVMLGQLVAGRYRLLQRLGAGGMGGVWLAHDEADDRAVAIKRCELPDGLTPDEQDLFRVWTVREARAFALVGHPNVVRTLDILPADDAPWIVMEYVESRSLQVVLDDSGPLPPARVAGIGLAVLEALLAVRRAGLLHLDVKPGNVLIARDGRVVLTDFGPAVTAEGVRALARAGIILGSPKYLAPERLEGLALPESDLWSLGATLYHAVEGHPPFVRATTAETLLALTEGPPDPPVLAGPLAPVIEALLSLAPADRPGPEQVLAGLRRVLRPEPAAIEHSPAVPGRRHRAALLAAALVVLIALVTVFVVARPEGQSAARPRAETVVGREPLPAGFFWYTDARGYRVALPLGWVPGRDGAGDMKVRGDGGWPILTVAVDPPPDGGVIAELTAREAEARLTGYRRIRIERLPTSADAVWEYTYKDARYGPVRAMRRAFLAPGDRMFTLEWRAPRDRWAAELALFDQVAGTFTPVPGQ
jgi:hypothetical protein